jgi:soluble lytic murein transglycosylase-like protein
LRSGLNFCPSEVEKPSMKYFKRFICSTTTFISISALLLSILLSGSASAQTYRRVFDIRSPLSQDILNLMTSLIREERCPNFPTPDLENITEGVQLAAEDYEIEPGFLLAMMAAEEEYSGLAQARLYYFNLDMGSALANSPAFPVAWFDAERVARAYKAESERYDAREMAIAAYFVGSQSPQLPSNGDAADLPQGLRTIVTNVLNSAAEWSHLGERNAPQVVEASAQTPATSYEQPGVDLTEIENAYVANMMYFNPRLDEETGHQIFEAIRLHAENYPEVDARLVMALVACESSFKPNAVSHAGAQGLGQLMPFTAEHFGVSDPFDIDENIRATFAYLQREVNRWSSYNYTLDRVLAAYNAGPGAVEEYSDAPYYGIPPYDETINYVSRVVNIYFYLLPEDERTELLSGKSRHVTETNGTVQMAQ